MRTPSVLLVALFLFAASAGADVPISAPVLWPATGWQGEPVIAGSGSDTLAVWLDQRAAPDLPPSNSPNWTKLEVYGSRIGPDGVPAVDFPVSSAPEKEVAAAVVWNGDEYVVAHAVLPRSGFEGGIRFTRVRVGDAQESSFIPWSEYASFPGSVGGAGALGLAWNGDEYLLVSSEYLGDPRFTVHGLLVDRSFRPIGSSFLIGTGVALRANVATDGRSFLVTWIAQRSVSGQKVDAIRAATVSASGAVGPEAEISDVPLGQRASAPSALWSGERYLVTWADESLRARFLDGSGTASSPVLHLGTEALTAAVAWNGSQYLIVFATRAGDALHEGIDAVHLDAAGNVLDPRPIVIVTSDQLTAVQPAVAAVGGRFLVVYGASDTIRSSLVVGNAPQTPVAVAQSLGNQYAPDGLFDGSRYAFTWTEEGHVFFGRVTPEGTVLDGGGLDLGEGGYSRIVFNGSMYAVAWDGPDASYVARIDRDGKLLDPAPLALPTTFIDMATDGRDFLLLTFTYGNPRGFIPVVLTAEGRLLPQPVVGNLPYTIRSASLAWNGSRYVLAFFHELAPDCYKCYQPYEVLVALLDRTGRAASAPHPVLSGTIYAWWVLTDPRTLLASAGGSTLLIQSVTCCGVTRLLLLDEQGQATRYTQLPDLLGVGALVWTGPEYLAVVGGQVQRIAADGSLLARFSPCPCGGHRSRCAIAGRGVRQAGRHRAGCGHHFPRVF